ncbi:MAG: hypothetical protein U1F09_01280 [Steroidobacteraceae bacterium]
MTSLTYVTSLEEVTWGLALIALTMVIHAVAMPGTIAACDIVRRRHADRSGFTAGVRVLLIASFLIVISHLVEVCGWAAFFYLEHAFPTASSSYYYALLQYTTVGSDLSLPDRWRLLGGMIAIAGALAFAWSTAVLLTLAQRFQDEQLRRMSIAPPPDA